MTPPAIVTTNVLVGTASLFTAPFGTAVPADTIVAGDAWGSPWTYIGATEEGVTVAYGTSTTDISVEEQATPVLVVTTAVQFELRFALSEDTVDSMKLAYGAGGSIATIASSAGVAAKKRLTLNSSLTKLAAGFEGVNADGFPRRVFVPAVLSIGDVSTPYRRAANNRSYPTVLRAVCDPSEIAIEEWTAAAAGP